VDITAILVQVLELMTPVLLAALAGALCERVGLFNVALEGMMLVGAFASIAAASLLHSTALGVVAALVVTVVFSLPMAVGSTRFRGDSVVIGIGLNLLAAGLTSYLLPAIFGVTGTYSDLSVASLPRLDIPLLDAIPGLGPIVSGHDPLVYFSWLATLLLGLFLFRTPWGLRLRGVGEQPAAAAAMGTDVDRYQAMAVLVGGALCGLAGADLALGSVTLFAENMTAGRGWIAVVAVMLGRAHPLGVLLACLLFGLADAIGLRLQGQGLPNQLTDIAPYVITLLALVLAGLRQLRRNAR
jgi:simple sugar transport system permease protein